METHQVQAPGPERKALQSWKEIAAFLNVTVRTVQRWEKSTRIDEARFSIDVLQCPRCGGRMRIIAAIHAHEDNIRASRGLGLYVFRFGHVAANQWKSQIHFTILSRAGIRDYWSFYP